MIYKTSFEITRYARGESSGIGNALKDINVFHPAMLSPPALLRNFGATAFALRVSTFSVWWLAGP
jgi:hypothetical protein